MFELQSEKDKNNKKRQGLKRLKWAKVLPNWKTEKANPYLLKHTSLPNRKLIARASLIFFHRFGLNGLVRFCK